MHFTADGLSSEELQWQNHLQFAFILQASRRRDFWTKVLITGSRTYTVHWDIRIGAEEIIVTDISTNALSFSNSVEQIEL